MLWYINRRPHSNNVMRNGLKKQLSSIARFFYVAFPSLSNCTENLLQSKCKLYGLFYMRVSTHLSNRVTRWASNWTLFSNPSRPISFVLAPDRLISMTSLKTMTSIIVRDVTTATTKLLIDDTQTTWLWWGWEWDDCVKSILLALHSGSERSGKYIHRCAVWLLDAIWTRIWHSIARTRSSANLYLLNHGHNATYTQAASQSVS